MKSTTKDIITGLIIVGVMIGLMVWASMSHGSLLGTQIGNNLVQLQHNMGAN